MTDWRALCAELAEQLDDALDFTVSSETRRHMKLLTGRARAALAQPEPQGKGEVAALAAWLKAHADEHTEERDGPYTRVAALLQQQYPQPVPVSERLPGADLCWWFTPESDEEYGWWVLETEGMEREPPPTHWLPAHALPLPTHTSEND